MEKEIVITDELIARYLAGDASPEEAIALQEWQQSDHNQKYYGEFEATWNSSYPAKSKRAVDKEAAWNKVSTELFSGSKSKSSFFTPLKIAASVILILSVGAITFFLTNSKASLVEQITEKDIERIQLPDQSVATLNRNTKIVYEKEFKGNTRELTLEGEAFFKVTPDKDKPFIIHTSAADIKVVGTSFNVISHDGQLEVSVVEGKVLILSNGKKEYIQTGYSAIVKAETESIEVKNAVDVNAMGYATHRFQFKGMPLAAVFQTLEKSYSYSINVSDKAIENCKFTGTFEDASVENILSFVAESLDLAVTKDGQTFVLQGKGCP
jgi:transmembrane sensor